jgi:WD40 repeat protein
MAYLEIKKDDRVVKHQRVDDAVARKGLRFKLGSLGRIEIALGQTKQAGPYTLSLTAGEGPSGPEANPSDMTQDVQGETESRLGFSFAAESKSVLPTHAPQIDGFRIIELLGQGGMGSVWRAEQLGTKREVALKVMAASYSHSSKAQARFEREVELTASLEHPNIARLFDSGLHRGVYYYAMELVQGGIPLDQYVQKKKLSMEQILVLFQQVCAAVQCAHQRGVIHRDLKPSNILVSQTGQPCVVDFGLARAFWGEQKGATLSVEGDIAGTLAYMAPEQAAGRQDSMDTRTDVYSLGVILTELTLGKSPHDLSRTTLDVLQRIRSGQIRRPRDLVPAVNRDLEAILLKCLALDMDDRYLAAGALEDDLNSFLKGDPVTAQMPTILYVLGKRARKYQRQLMAGFVATFLLIAGGLYGFDKWEEYRIRIGELEIEAKLGRLKRSQLEELVEKGLGKDNAEAHAALSVLRDQYNSLQEENQDLKTKTQPAPPPMRRINASPGGSMSPQSLVKDAALPSQVDGWTLETVTHRGPIVAIEAHPKNQQLASIGVDGTLRVWNSASDEPNNIIIPGAAKIEDLAWLADSNKVMLCHFGDAVDITLWDLQTQKLLRTIALGQIDTDYMRLSESTRYVALHVVEPNAIQIKDPNTKETVRVLPALPGMPRHMAWSHNDQYLAVVNASGSLSVWDWQNTTSEPMVSEKDSTVDAIAWAHQTAKLAIGRSGHIDVIDVPSGTGKEPIEISLDDPIQQIAWSSSDQWLSFVQGESVAVVNHTDAQIRRFDIPNAHAHTWMNEDGTIAVGDSTGSLICLDIHQERKLPKWTSYWCGSSQQSQFSPDGMRLAVLSKRGLLTLWDAGTWQPLMHSQVGVAARGEREDTLALTWSVTGNEIIRVGTRKGALVVFDSRDLQLKRRLQLPKAVGNVTCLDHSKRGLIAATDQGAVCFWPTEPSAEVLIRRVNSRPINAIAWLKDGERFISGEQDGGLRIWDLISDQPITRLPGHNQTIVSLSVSLDGQKVASADPGGGVLVWDLQSGRRIDDASKHDRQGGNLTALVWSPNSRHLAIGEAGGQIRIWDTQKKNVSHRIDAGHSSINHLAWSEGGRYLAASVEDGTVRTWDVVDGFRSHVLLLPLWGPMAPGMAVAEAGDFRGPPQINPYLRYVARVDETTKTFKAQVFRNLFGWVNEPWQVGLFEAGSLQVQRLYVNADAQGPFDGLTWETAFKDLQVALSCAKEGTDIWVAQGRYTPDRGSREREASFELRKKVRLYGGFAGHETTFQQRDPQAYPSTLSGDLDGNDRGFINNQENSLHVVTVGFDETNAVLNGFIVTGGHAVRPQTEGEPDYHDLIGGGLRGHAESLAIVDCVFEFNVARERGGGLYIDGQDSLVEACRFIRNEAAIGGGINASGNSIQVKNCRFEDNRANTGGGENCDGEVVMTDCRFIGNVAESHGGAMTVNHATLIRCIFIKNKAEGGEGGGAIHTYGDNISAIASCFMDNTAPHGGAIAILSPQNKTYLEDCAFIGNSAMESSGTIWCEGGHLEVINCTVVNNKVITNRIPGRTGGISYSRETDPITKKTKQFILSNCILWGNTSPANSSILQQLEADPNHVEIQNCCIQGWPNEFEGQGNFGDNPLFANLAGPDQIPGTEDDDVSLSPNSPCIDRGDSALIGIDRWDMDSDQDVNEPLPFDIKKRSRIWGGSVDIGASEFRSTDPVGF